MSAFSDTDRNLLFGLMVLQLGLIDPQQFAEACAAWSEQRPLALADLLVERGWITARDRSDLERLLEEKLRKQSSNPVSTVGYLTLDQLQPALATVEQTQVRQSLLELTQMTSRQPVDVVHESPPLRARYTRTRLHAKGGLGQVWLARDEAVGREVALKELRPEGHDHPALEARFLEEARITGQLEHPSIVPVYEVNPRVDGLPPYYTMRFIRGRTLTLVAQAYHEKRKNGQASPLELRELLNAFVAVCQAVAYAHARGVIHRDLKGPNVVLGEFGEVMVLDWGLAKVLAVPNPKPDQPPGPATPIPVHDTPPLVLEYDQARDATVQGTVLGTPAYMSPEQAEGRHDQLDCRSDVYGLGAILYEILTGRPPFSGRDLESVLRQVRQEEPVRPRQRVAETPLALEAICLKALAKQPAQRYESAAELAREVQRWLADEPVGAYIEPWPARLARWGRRHRPLVAGGLVLLITAVLALSAGTMLLRWKQEEVTRERNAAQAAEIEARQRQEEAETNFRLARDAVDQYLTHVGESKDLKAHGLEPLRRQLLETAKDFYERFIRERAEDPRLRHDLALAYFKLGNINQAMGDHSQAAAQYAQAVGVFERLVEENAGRADYAHELAKCYSNQGLVFSAIDRKAEARAAYRKALAVWERLLPADPNNRDYLRSNANLQNNLGAILQSEGRVADAETAYQQAAAVQERLVRAAADGEKERAQLARFYTNLGNLYANTNRSDKAYAEYRRALAIKEKLVHDAPTNAGHRHSLAISQYNLGRLYALNGRQKDGEGLYRQALDRVEQLCREHPAIADYQELQANLLNNIGLLCHNSDRLEQAEAAYVRTLAIRERMARESPANPQYQQHLAMALNNLGQLYHQTDRLRQADEVLKRAAAILERFVRDHPRNPEHMVDLGGLCANWALVTVDLGKPEAGLALCDRAFRLLGSVPKGMSRDPDLRLDLRIAHAARAGAFVRQKRLAEALKEWDQAITFDDRHDIPVRLGRLETLARLGEHARAAQEGAVLAQAQRLSAGQQYVLGVVYAQCAVAAQKDPALVAADRDRQTDAYAAQAVAYLRQAAAGGYFKTASYRERLKEEILLDVLRPRNDFRELLQDVAEEGK
jgi:serine/threonine-protein kinase